MSTPSADGISDEAESELPSTEVPTTESDIKTEEATASTTVSTTGSGGGSGSGTGTGTGSGSGSGTGSPSGSPLGSGSASTSGSSSSVKKSGSGSGQDSSGGAEEAGATEDDTSDEPPPKPKPKKSQPPPPPPTAAPQTDGDADADAKGDVSAMYEKRFIKILARKRREEEEIEKKIKSHKIDINELNSCYKAWVLDDFERQQQERPPTDDKLKKKRQEEVRLQKAQEAFCTWLSYKKQQMQMERRCYRLQRKERRQLVRKRSRADSETAYQQWLADKRHQFTENNSTSCRIRMSNPPVVHTRDMSMLYAKSYACGMAKQRRARSAGGRRGKKDEYLDVENVYCPEHKTEYRLETRRTQSGSCYRLTSVRKLDC